MSKLVTDLSKELGDLMDQSDTLDEQLKAVKKRINVIKTVALPEAMEDADIKKVTVDGAGSISLKTEVYASILKEDRERWHQWLRETGNGDLVVDHVWPGTQKAFIKERIETMQEYPDFCTVTMIPTASLRRSQ